MTHAQHDLLMIHALADSELDAVHAAQIEARLADCPECAAIYAQLAAQRGVVAGARRLAPARLRQRLADSLAAVTAPEAVPIRRTARWAWMGGGAGMAVAACAAMFALSLQIGDDSALTRDLVAGHVRSLQASHLTDIATSDQHVVKPWFNGRLDFAPPVVELKDQGFPLLGGRLDYLGGRTVAAIVYRRGRHIINLFVWPSRGLATEAEIRPGDGYDLRRWRAGGLTFWAVSDVNRADLALFEEQIRLRLRS